jgi:Flp pilus assembly protein TadG
MAMLAPFLILLFLGAVESGWFLVQSLDVVHAAREGGRVAGVNSGDTNAIVAAACTFMDDSSNTDITISGASAGLGDEVVVTVTKQATTLTGLLDPLFSPPVTLSHSSTFVLEHAPALWSNASNQPCP